jgi:hypothetical protein
MARAQAQYLRIYEGTFTHRRWQNGYINSTVTWAGGSWPFLDFNCDGLIDGADSDEGGLSVTLPATPEAIAEVEAALALTRLVELTVYEFDELQPGATIAPLADQVLVASHVGEVVGASGVMENLTIEIGTSLTPIGPQIPPRMFTSRLVGVPCKL